MENKNMTVEKYALKILSDAGCDCHTYDGECLLNVLEDLKKAFPNGMDYPYVDVANAILEISRLSLMEDEMEEEIE